jgi:hypothetical protein
MKGKLYFIMLVLALSFAAAFQQTSPPFDSQQEKTAARN